VGLALRRGASVLGLTDDPEGPLARSTPHRFVLGTAPPEALGCTDYRDPEAALYTGYHRPVPQTKTFGALQLALALLCLELEHLAASGRGSPREAVEADLAGLSGSAGSGARAAESAARTLLGRARPRCRVTFCGTGLNASTARFCAYKLLELAVPAAFADIEEFCHTQYLVTERGDAVVFLAEGEGALERVGEIAPVVEEELGAASVTLSTAPASSGAFAAEPVTPEVSPLVLAHAGAHLVRRLALSWGLDTDRFRAGVEEERYVRGSTRMIRGSRIR
jgi:glucosamine 6-phosphate synthetase-like amidotransferase/phosphosugar isomerase protein